MIIRNSTADEILTLSKDPEMLYFGADDRTEIITPEMAQAAAEANVMYTIEEDGEVVGVFAVERFQPWNFARVHIAIYSKWRGKKVWEACRLGLDLMRKENLKMLVADIPSNNRKAMVLAAAMGFERVGKRDYAWSKDGILFDIIEYEKELTCQHYQ